MYKIYSKIGLLNGECSLRICLLISNVHEHESNYRFIENANYFNTRGVDPGVGGRGAVPPPPPPPME